MPATYSYPGVYVEETSFRSKPIEGVSTSARGLLGSIRRGVDAIVKAAAFLILASNVPSSSRGA